MINASLGAHYSPRFVSRSIGLFWRTMLGMSNNQAIATLKQKLNHIFSGQTVLTYKGRDAIELALRGYGLTNRQAVVLTQAFTCFAIEEAIVRAGATPEYVDLGKNQLNLTTATLQQAAKRHGKKVKAVIVQHSLGHPAEIGKIRQWCDKHSILLIEDLAQSFGGLGEGKPLGTYGDAVILSFGRDKVIDAVTGGAVVFRTAPTNNHAAFLQPPKAIILKDLAYPFFTWLIRATYDSGLGKVIHRLLTVIRLMGNPTQAPTKTITALPNSIASLALLQLESFETQLGHRQSIAQLYLAELAETPLKFLTEEPDLHDGSLLRVAATTDDPAALLGFLKQHNIHLTDRWYRTPVDCGLTKCDTVYQQGQCPRAAQLSETIINLPTHQKITEREAKKIIATIKKFFAK